MVLCIFNYWNASAQIITINFPRFINWIGIIGLWLGIPFDIANFYYNVNFTRLYKPLKDKYVLATGGPYKYVRHPMYVAGAMEVITFFLATGIWIIPFYLIIFLIALPFQANGEEELLKGRFGKIYVDYMAKVGRFVPKLKKV